MKKFSVYVITCMPNGKMYVGMTSQVVSKRIANGKKYVGRLGKAISKYGWEAFTYKVVCDGLDIEDAKALETSLIEQLDTRNPSKGYNTTKGGECMFIGHSQTDETRDKISRSLKGVVFTDEHRKRISDAKSGARHHAAKKVYQYAKDGTLVKVWDYMGEAAKAVGVTKSSISHACVGITKTCQGFTWSYVPLGGMDDTDLQ